MDLKSKQNFFSQRKGTTQERFTLQINADTQRPCYQMTWRFISCSSCVTFYKSVTHLLYSSLTILQHPHFNWISKPHRKRNCLYQLTMSSATPKLVKQREGIQQTSVNFPTYKPACKIKLLASEPIHKQHFPTVSAEEEGGQCPEEVLTSSEFISITGLLTSQHSHKLLQ